MRKKFSIIFLAVVMSFSFIVNAFAASAIDPVTIDYGDGYTLKVSTVDISTFTVREKTITRQADAYHGSTYIGTFYLTGTLAKQLLPVIAGVHHLRLIAILENHRTPEHRCRVVAHLTI